MNRVYIAALFEARGRLLPYAQELVRRGYKVTSRWLHENEVEEEGHDDDARKALHAEIAWRDCEDVSDADLLILDTLNEDVRGGREVEWGLALARRMPRYIVGPRRNVFHALATRIFTDWGEALRFFALRAKEADEKRDDGRDGGRNHR